MGCSGCPEKDKDTSYDKHGNPVLPEPSVLGSPPKIVTNEVQEMSYSDYKKRRDEFRAASRNEGNKHVKALSDDYKRIQIDSLIAVYNLDDVDFKLTPSQALVALWEFAHHPEFQKVFNEFEDLREQVDKKYAEIKKDIIIIKWNP